MSLSVKEQLNIWGKSKTPFVFLIDFECAQPKCWDLSKPIADFKFNFKGFTNFNDQDISTQKIDSTAIESKQPISFEEYAKKFELVKKELEYGNSFLVNLTAATKIKTNLSIETIAHHANAKYICWLKNNFVCFSPETFVEIKNGKITSLPMKGTIDANVPNAKEVILKDAKEIAEHATIVDLIRNDLSRVATRVQVKKYRYYEEIKTQDGILGQVSSEIEGTLPENYNEMIGDIIFNLLPAGSVSGAPKQKTKKIIFNAEGIERGYYTGIAGYFDGVNLDSCVLIRYLQENLVYRSGGGITAQSSLENEYNEMINKVYVPIF